MVGVKIEWTEEMLDMIRNEFPVTLNDRMAQKMGISQRSIIRKARELNIQKDPKFREINIQEIICRVKKGQAISENNGWKRHQFPKGHKSSHQFQKGHDMKLIIGEERYRQMHERGAAKRRETLKLEKARAAFGLPQKTKLRVTKQSKRKIHQNGYLRKRGYTLDIQNGIAYYNQDTKRSMIIEKRQQYFKFINND